MTSANPLNAGFVSRIVLVGGLSLLALVLIAFAIPLGGIDRAGAGPLSLALWAAILFLAGVAGYLGSMTGALGFAILVGLAGPYLARMWGPPPDEGFIPLLSVPIVLLPLLLLPGVLGVMVRWWR